MAKHLMVISGYSDRYGLQALKKNLQIYCDLSVQEQLRLLVNGVLPDPYTVILHSDTPVERDGTLVLCRPDPLVDRWHFAVTCVFTSPTDVADVHHAFTEPGVGVYLKKVVVTTPGRELAPAKS